MEKKWKKKNAHNNKETRRLRDECVLCNIRIRRRDHNGRGGAGAELLLDLIAIHCVHQLLGLSGRRRVLLRRLQRVLCHRLSRLLLLLLLLRLLRLRLCLLIARGQLKEALNRHWLVAIHLPPLGHCFLVNHYLIHHKKPKSKFQWIWKKKKDLPWGKAPARARADSFRFVFFL